MRPKSAVNRESDVTAFGEIKEQANGNERKGETR